MPRIEPQKREEMTDPVALMIYERKFGSLDASADGGTATGAPGNYELVFAKVPAVLEHMVRGFGLWRNKDMRLAPLLRELALTRVGWAAGSQFLFSQHCKVLRGVGGTEEQVSGITSWQVCNAYSPVHRAVLGYTDCLVYDHGRVSDGLFAELRRHLSDEEIIELTYIAASYVMQAGMIRALRLEFDDRDDLVVEVPAPDGFDFAATADQPLIIPDR
jgi:alkylhydroperoxidase family enzyme